MPDFVNKAGEDRVMKLEDWAHDHEVKCTERYTAILSKTETVHNDMAEMKLWLHRRMDWTLGVLIVLALSSVFDQNSLLSLAGRIFRIGG
jgi:hypothetical protein